MNRLGLFLCGAYAASILVCAALYLSAGADTKGALVFMQLPIALQGALAHELGLDGLLADLSLLGAYTLLGLPSFVPLYVTSWAISHGAGLIARFAYWH